MKNLKTAKTAKTNADYTVNAFGYSITVPKGSTVSNKTAYGCDDNYRFWRDWQKIAKEVTGYNNSTLAHDLTHYGINVPQEYCEQYK